VALLASDCASPAPAPAATARPTAVPPAPEQPTATLVQPTQPPATAGKTAGELATLGYEVYKKSCGRCHDDPFAGPLSNGLRDFRNAQELLRFMQTRMPQDAPGSLLAEQYFQVLADILVDGQAVPADAVLDGSKLAEIVFK
jgi:hypothetical protein